MARPRLTYFDAPTSRGEECRLALYLGGVDFEDHRIPRSAWPALKPKTPFGTVPVLELEGKPMLSQSNAILAHIGRRYGLLPTGDDWEATRLESLLAATEDLRSAVSETFDIKDPDELIRRRRELVAGPIKTWGANMEKQVKGPFAGGETISVADIKIFVVMRWLGKGVLDHVPTDVLAEFPRLQTLSRSVQNHPKVIEWHARGRAETSPGATLSGRR